jgi:hypothetical protein
MRKIIGMAAGAYMPQVGREIMAPGYDRQMRDYNANKQRMMDEGKLNHQQAQEDAQVAAARAAMARAEASNAQKQRTMGQMANDKNYNLGPGYARFDASNNQVAVNKLPEKPPAPGLRITKVAAEALGIKVPDGQDYYDVPNQGTSAFLTTRPRADRGYDTMKQAVHDEHPDWEQADVDAEAAKRYREAKEAEKKRTEAQATRALRPPTGRTGGAAGTATANAEARRNVDELAKEQVFKAGGDPNKAIANMESWPTLDDTAKKVLLHLKAMQGAAAMRPSKGKVDVDAIAARFGAGAAAATKASTPPATPKPVDKNKDPLGVR